MKGDTGSEGIQGIASFKGDTGSQGIQGTIGNKGDIGIQGIQGIKGTDGADDLIAGNPEAEGGFAILSGK